MQSNPTIIMWFRQDLRVADNPALVAAVRAGDVLPIYILDDEDAGEHAMGAASRWWLHHGLQDLDDSLKGGLRLYKGDAKSILNRLISNYDISEIHWNRCYEPWRIKRDATIKKALQEQGVECHSHKASLLWEPWEARKDDDTPYKVFTPFYKKGCLNAAAPRDPMAPPANLRIVEGTFDNVDLTDLDLLPTVRWDKKLAEHWIIGEKGAKKRMETFMVEGLEGYKEGRNFPAQSHVSRLSPYLHFGHVSPNQVWYEAQARGEGKDSDHFMSELGWREFSHSLLYHFPELPTDNLQTKFDAFPWRDDKQALKRWQKGQTGYPIVDAGMRELWQTGYMHNRVRMIVGSFLVKNLLLHWHHGEAWFWDCLVDADLANNSASWQWVTGCGADAAPYFRIFNPVTQGQKFDPQGYYTRQYVPELKNLPDKYLFKPWDAPESTLQGAGITLGKDYPKPIVELKGSRQRALEAFQSIKKEGA